MNADLQRFVREALARGQSRESIRGALSGAGWRPGEIDAALRGWAEGDFPVPVPRRRTQLEARDAFLYLVLFATLYTTAYNTGQVLFMLIERWFPDPLLDPRLSAQHGTWIRGATAGLIIAFPVFLFLSRLIGRDATAGDRDSAVRKWLTYLTLLVAALVIIGTLIVLVTRVLGGELAPRFVLKVAVVLAIAGVVFGHSLGGVRRDDEQGPRRAGWLARLAVAGVFATLAAGLIFAGSPARERQRQLDEQRIQALGAISSALQSYVDDRGALPDSLGTLLRRPGGVARVTLLDPVSGRPYEYQRVDSLTYELCAEFQTDDRPPVARLPETEPRRDTDVHRGAGFWAHGPGRNCFRFEVARPRPPRS